MKKGISLAKELLLITITILLALGFFFFTYDNILSRYYEAIRDIILSDYLRLRHNFHHLYVLLFAARILLPLLGLYFLVKKTGAWLYGKETKVKSGIKKVHEYIRRSGIYVRLFHALAIIILLVITEKYLEKSGYNRGFFYKHLFSMSEKSRYYCDSVGITKLDPNNKKDWDYWGSVNREGFRSKYEFDSLSLAALKRKGKKVIMFIGDSFTEGLTAIPRDSCFVDLVDGSPNYTALNFGIGGTDPLQYKLVAFRYVPDVKPDAVVVVSYSNDIMQYDRIPTPGVPVFWSLGEAQKPIQLGYKPNDVFKSNEEAWEFYKQYSTVPDDNFFGRLCSKRNITTQMWHVLHAGDAFPYMAPKDGLPYTYNNLRAVKEWCDSIRVPVLFFHIPHIADFSEPDEKIIDKNTSNFKDLPVHYILGLSSSDHASTGGDNHFNNSGHAKFAAFVTEVLDSVFGK